jgi:hypothetical protein
MRALILIAAAAAVAGCAYPPYADWGYPPGPGAGHDDVEPWLGYDPFEPYDPQAGRLPYDPLEGRFGDYSYEGRDFADPDWRDLPDAFRGPGAELLDPWLSRTREGEEILVRRFGVRPGGFLDADTAEKANLWFRRYADTNGDLLLTDEEIRMALVQTSR